MAEIELTTLARPYARAAFSYALDQEGGLVAWSRMLGLLAAVLDAKAVQQALDNPHSTTDDERQLVTTILGDDLTPAGRNFVALLAEYGRLALIPRIYGIFERMKSNHEQMMGVKVTSAYDLSDSQRADLSESLQRRLQRSIRLSIGVDRALIGGLVIKAEDTVIDDSVKGRLQKLAQALH